MTTLGPVYSLPTETLISIFESFPRLEWRPTWLDSDYSVNVSQVCRRWREVSLGSPRLWAHVMVMNPEYLSACLQRSRDQPIGISWEFSDTPSPRKLFSILAPHCARIQELFLDSNSAADCATMLKLLGLTSNRLEYLSISAYDQGPSTMKIPKTALSSTVRPTYLVLENARLPPASSFYSELRELIIFHDIHLPPNDLLDVLEFCPRLETLKLTSTPDLELREEDQHEPPRRTASLPHLKTIYHCDMFSDDIGYQLQCYDDLPSQINLGIEFQLWTHRPSAGMLGWLTNPDHRHPILSQMVDVKVCIRRGYVGYGPDQDKAVITAEAKPSTSEHFIPGVEITVSLDHDIRDQVKLLQRDVLCSFPQMFEGSTITSVSLAMHDLRNVQRADWLEALPLLPALTYLSVISFTGHIDKNAISRLFDVLNPDSNVSPPTVYLPRLKDLVLCECRLDHEDVVRRCLEERGKLGFRVEYLAVSFHEITEDTSLWLDVEDLVGSFDFAVMPRNSFQFPSQFTF